MEIRFRIMIKQYWLDERVRIDKRHKYLHSFSLIEKLVINSRPIVSLHILEIFNIGCQLENLVMDIKLPISQITLSCLIKVH